MRQFVLTLAALGVLSVATNQARADGDRARPVAAKHAVYHADHDGDSVSYHLVRHRHHRYHRHHWHHPHWGYGPRVHHYYVPHARHYYWSPHYYHSRGGFSYYGPGVSIGIGW